MESTLTGNPDTDRLILLDHLDDADLFRACRTDRYTASLCTKEFWQQKLTKLVGRRLHYADPQALYKKIRTSQSDDTLLVWAASNGIQSLVELLLDRGANIHYRDEAPLYWAVVKGHTSIVSLLIKKGAYLNAYKRDLIADAVNIGNVGILKLLLDAEAQPQDIGYLFGVAMKKKYDDIVITLLRDRRTALNAVVLESLLNQAVLTENYPIIDEIVALGVDLNTVSWQIIVNMIKRDSISLIEHFIDLGLRIDQYNAAYYLLEAAENNAQKIVSFLLARFPNIQVRFADLVDAIARTITNKHINALLIRFSFIDRVNDLPDLPDRTIRILLLGNKLWDLYYDDRLNTIRELLNLPSDQEIDDERIKEIINDAVADILQQSPVDRDGYRPITQKQYEQFRSIIIGKHLRQIDPMDTIRNIPHAASQLLGYAVDDRWYELVELLIMEDITFDSLYDALVEAFKRPDEQLETILLARLSQESLDTLFVMAFDKSEYPRLNYDLIIALINAGADIHSGDYIAFKWSAKYLDRVLYNLLKRAEEQKDTPENDNTPLER